MGHKKRHMERGKCFVWRQVCGEGRFWEGEFPSPDSVLGDGDGAA